MAEKGHEVFFSVPGLPAWAFLQFGGYRECPSAGSEKPTLSFRVIKIVRF
jgi:hypothetical protein